MSGILFRPQYFSSLPSAAMSPLCGVRAIYILAMCIAISIFDFHWPPMLEIGRWTWNVLTWVAGPRALWGSWPVTLDADRAPVPLTVFRSDSGFDRGLGFFGLGVLGRSWGDFAHVTTVTPSWRVRNFVVIGGIRFEPERGGVLSGFGFGRGIVGGTGVRAVKSAHVRQSSWPKYLFIFCFCCSLVVLCHVMLAINCTKIEKLNWKLNWKYIVYGQNARYLFHMATV